MLVVDIILLASAGLLAGAINAVAGGGTFFTFSALLAVGLPPIMANASSAVAVVPGSVASLLAYFNDIKQHARRFIVLGLISAVGGGIGASLLLRLSNTAFKNLVPYLLLCATILFALSPLLSKRDAQTSKPSRLRYLLGLGLQFITSVYGGFFGAGMGIVMLASLALTESNNFHLNNAAKNVFAVLIQSVAVIFFILSGVVSWTHVLIVMIFCIAGGYGGVIIARYIPIVVIRSFVICMGFLLSLYYFFRAS
ncbi:MAG: sulfite exporter TauE/SafE family protein [Trueperaceae bacterium]